MNSNVKKIVHGKAMTELAKRLQKGHPVYTYESDVGARDPIKSDTHPPVRKMDPSRKAPIRIKESPKMDQKILQDPILRMKYHIKKKA